MHFDTFHEPQLEHLPLAKWESTRALQPEAHIAYEHSGNWLATLLQYTDLHSVALVGSNLQVWILPESKPLLVGVIHNPPHVIFRVVLRFS